MPSLSAEVRNKKVKFQKYAKELQLKISQVPYNALQCQHHILNNVLPYYSTIWSDFQNNFVSQQKNIYYSTTTFNLMKTITNNMFCLLVSAGCGDGFSKSSIRSVTLNWVSYQSNRLSESNLLIGRLSSTNWDFLWLFTSHAWTSSQTHYLISSFIQTISNHTAEHIKSYHLIYALSCLLTLCKRNCYANQSSV